MDIIPLIYLMNDDLFGSEEGPPLSFERLSELVKRGSLLYVLDADGLELDDPCYELFQMLAPIYDLWIDTGPRVIGDIVDDVFAGAARVSLRRNLFIKMAVEDVQALTDSPLYDVLSSEDDMHVEFGDGVDGFVITALWEDVQADYQMRRTIEELVVKGEVYAYDPDGKGIGFWKSLGCCGVLVDADIASDLEENPYGL